MRPKREEGHFVQKEFGISNKKKKKKSIEALIMEKVIIFTCFFKIFILNYTGQGTYSLECLVTRRLCQALVVGNGIYCTLLFVFHSFKTVHFCGVLKGKIYISDRIHKFNHV